MDPCMPSHLFFNPEDLHWALMWVLAETSSLTCYLCFSWCFITPKTTAIPVVTPSQANKENILGMPSEPVPKSRGWADSYKQSRAHSGSSHAGVRKKWDIKPAVEKFFLQLCWCYFDAPLNFFCILQENVFVNEIAEYKAVVFIPKWKNIRHCGKFQFNEL